MPQTQDYTRQLIARQSITPDDAGCQAQIAAWLQAAGFEVRDYSSNEVINTLYTRAGGDYPQRPHLLLLGHTDVVPPGPRAQWHSNPFAADERDGMLYGRGAADMKGAVAAMVTAMQAFTEHYPDHAGRLSLLLTSDEEGPAKDGVRVVVPALQRNQLLPDYCLVGEPSSLHRLGDNIRIGRRGSIHARLCFAGEQGHTAYADPADNPVHRAMAVLQAITAHRFDDGDEHFPATMLHVSNIQAGTGANNVTPATLEVRFNVRNNPATPAAQIKARIETLLAQHDCGSCQLDWEVSGEPFVTASGALVQAVDAAVAAVLGLQPVHDTGGGTSDGRFFAAAGCQVVELGLVNASIHRINEHVRSADLDLLHTLYYDIIRRLLTTAG